MCMSILAYRKWSSARKYVNDCILVFIAQKGVIMLWNSYIVKSLFIIGQLI